MDMAWIFRKSIASLAWAVLAGVLAADARTLLLLPVQGEAEKLSDLAAVNDLYREVILNNYQGQVHSPEDSAHQCGDRNCATALARAAKADEVIVTTVRRLGEKWIFSSTLMNADGENAFLQRGTALDLADLEAVTRRVGEALLARKPVERVANLDNITAKEETSEPTRRRSLFITGFSLGYLYPVNGSYSYLKYNGAAPSELVEEQPYNQMIRLAWLNTWEFREDMMVGFDAVWSIPNVIGGDINLQYLFNRSDFTPFLGGGVGIHYVVPDDDSISSSHRNSGPALNVQGGMVLFRTYDIHVIARAQYQMIFNSDFDNGISADVGVVYQRRERASGGGFGGKLLLYYVVGALVVSVIGAASD
jgi:hypothetical protein